ncbi:hypothetical protein HanPSC8_Chr12g0512541 [Helianthus annuus]|nr:hypothetical protein HanPSC8_Chr12g0512541 [Helianthus annuus]
MLDTDTLTWTKLITSSYCHLELVIQPLHWARTCLYLEKRVDGPMLLL